MKENANSITTRKISFILIGIYGISLLTILVVSIFLSFSTEGNGETIWFDLFKNGFLFIGGALTTIIGYYFGSKGVEAAQQKAVEAEVQLKENEKTIKADMETFDEDTLDTPSEIH